MKKFMTLRKSKKGFTLVELLVVLVIIAILMAAIIPSMMGFINKAKEEAASAECRNIALAANVVLNEEYGKGTAVAADMLDGKTTEIKDIAGTAAGPTDITVNIADPKAPKVATITYTASNGTKYSYTATDNVWVVVP